MKKLIALILIIAPFFAHAQLELPYGIKVLGEQPTDAWYGPYESVEAANAAVPKPVRLNRTVKIGTLEYWWRDGNEDEDLILKSSAPAQTTIPWDSITSRPTTLSGYGITDPVVLTSVSYSNPSWLTGLAWSKISSRPTTISGYGITDGVVGPASATGDAFALFNGTTGKLIKSSNLTENSFIKSGGTTTLTNWVDVEGNDWEINLGTESSPLYSFRVRTNNGGSFRMLGNQFRIDPEGENGESASTFSKSTWQTIVINDNNDTGVSGFALYRKTSQETVEDGIGVGITLGVQDKSMNTFQPASIWHQLVNTTPGDIEGKLSFDVKIDNSTRSIFQLGRMTEFGDAIERILIKTQPANSDTAKQVLVRDYLTGEIKYRNAESFSGSSITYGDAGTVPIVNSGEDDFDYTSYKLPLTDGTNGQVLQTDGSGNVSWANVSGGGGGVTIEQVMDSVYNFADSIVFHSGFETTKNFVGKANFFSLNSATGQFSFSTSQPAMLWEYGKPTVFFSHDFLTISADDKINIQADSVIVGNTGQHILFKGLEENNDSDSVLVVDGSGRTYYRDASTLGGGGSPDWGDIGGTLSDQTDLQSALDGKADLSGDTFTGKVNFTAGATNAGLNIGSYNGEPSGAVDGDLWYRSGNHRVMVRSNSFNYAIALIQPDHISSTRIPVITNSNGQMGTNANFTFSSNVLSTPSISVSTGATLPAATSIGDVSSTEIGYLDGVTSSIQTQLNSKQTITPTSSTGTAVAFDTNRSYCTSASPCTGNITFNSSGAVVGQIATMVHNDSSEPTFGAEFIILSGEYKSNENNYIMFFLRESGKVWVTISQEQ